MAIGATDNTLALARSESWRVSYSGVNNGLVQSESSYAIPAMAAERAIYKVNDVYTSFSEMMALPNTRLDTTYWFPGTTTSISTLNYALAYHTANKILSASTATA